MNAFKLGGIFTIEHVRDGQVIDTWESQNIITNQGLNHALNVVLHGTPGIATWFIGLFSGNYIPVAGDTAAAFPAAATEFTGYSAGTRLEWVEATAGASNQIITNGSGAGSSKATFTMTGPGTIYGAFLVSDSGKGATAGTLFAASRFSASRAVVANDQLVITYTLQAASV